jgi:hypothetical protein
MVRDDSGFGDENLVKMQADAFRASLPAKDYAALAESGQGDGKERRRRVFRSRSWPFVCGGIVPGKSSRLSSSGQFGLVVPGIGTIHGSCASSCAMAICALVAWPVKSLFTVTQLCAPISRRNGRDHHEIAQFQAPMRARARRLDGLFIGK